MTIQIEDAWVYWFKKEKSIHGLKEEMEALEITIKDEKDFPFKGDEWLRMQFKKRVMLWSKIKQLEERSGS